jgi:hypothetical protein
MHILLSDGGDWRLGFVLRTKSSQSLSQKNYDPGIKRSCRKYQGDIGDGRILEKPDNTPTHDMGLNAMGCSNGIQTLLQPIT